MKQLQKLMSKPLLASLCLISIGGFGQSESKTFSEDFNVEDDVVIDINTSYTDIEFETWNKDKVVIEATITWEGSSGNDVSDYFENSSFEIMGNSRRVTIASKGTSISPFHLSNEIDFDIELPEIPDFDSFKFNLSEMKDLPVMPPVPSPKFDYEEYEKKGEKYLKDWQKNFEENFGEPYRERMDKWQQKKGEKQRKVHEKRQEAHVKMAEARAEQALERAELNQRRMVERQARIGAQKSAHSQPNIFYKDNDGRSKKYEVKRSIKIRMPKSARIKMNVRHGEVKLAERTNNLEASLSYAKLSARAIEGNKTMVMASYSPIEVENWFQGELRTNFSEYTDLKNVTNIKLSSKSSEVTITNLTKNADIKNSFGPIYISSISDDFEALKVVLEYSEMVCELPKTAYALSVSEIASEIIFPEKVQMIAIKNNQGVAYSGFNMEENSRKSVSISSKYGEVVLK
ncbi:hypothetical protein B0O79_0660 [Flavobacteriaceae bacterium MAR_2009_75]|nr:hypothetical protein B0O79_0660 [Flavobacteriaceae bacterium MAR_2009_75]